MGPPNEVTPSLRKTRKTSPVEPRTSSPFKPSASTLAGKGATPLFRFQHLSAVAYVSQLLTHEAMCARLTVCRSMSGFGPFSGLALCPLLRVTRNGHFVLPEMTKLRYRRCAHNWRTPRRNAQYLRSSNLVRSSRWITAKTMAVETPNMRAPFAASNGPNNRHDGVISRSP